MNDVIQDHKESSLSTVPDSTSTSSSSSDRSQPEIGVATTTANTSSTKPLVRKVHFGSNSNDEINAEIACYVPARSDLTTSDHNSIWWEDDDFEVFMFSAHQSSIDGRKDSKRLVKAFQNCSSAENKPPPPKALDELKHWCSSDSSRGLERWCNMEFTQRRDLEQNDLIKAVLEEQAKENDSREEKEKTLSQISQQYSTRAKQFARTMGAADAAVVEPRTNPGSSTTATNTNSGTDTDANKHHSFRLKNKLHFRLFTMLSNLFFRRRRNNNGNKNKKKRRSTRIILR